MFKANWERTSSTITLPEGMVTQMVGLAYPKKDLLSSELLAGGCSNLNFKILLKNTEHPLLLRVYLRDQEAASREKNIGIILKNLVAAPETYFIGEYKGYSFAMTEFISGISLRELLLSDKPYNLKQVMTEIGLTLSKIASYHFPKAGFLDKDLNVVPYQITDIVRFAQDCLRHKTVLAVLSSESVQEIQTIFHQYGHLLPDNREKHLVHGDFDPANVLVDRVNNVWKVVGILDFEFAFSGSILWDIANMLRYAHKMPVDYQTSFLESLNNNGIKLPDNWPKTINLLNLSSLLDCLKRSDAQTQPNRCQDIRDLIHHILAELRSNQ